MSGQSKNVRVKRKLRVIFSRQNYLSEQLARTGPDKPNREKRIRAEIAALRFAAAAIEKLYPGAPVPENYKQELY